MVAAEPKSAPVDDVTRTMGEVWSLLETVCAGSASAEARLDLFDIVAVEGSIVRVRPRTPGQEQRVRSLEPWIAERMTQAIGRPVRAVTVTQGPSEQTAPSIDAPDAAITNSVRAAALQSDPVVRLALDLFDGRIVSVEQGAPKPDSQD